MFVHVSSLIENLKRSLSRYVKQGLSRSNKPNSEIRSVLSEAKDTDRGRAVTSHVSHVVVLWEHRRTEARF